MLLRNIEIKNLRLLRNLRISFENADGRPRQWTVFIGRNGTGKTSILQAIALAAAGNAGAINLSGRIREQLPDVRVDEGATIDAEFAFGEIGRKHGERPLADGRKPDGLCVEVKVPRGKHDPLSAMSWYSTDQKPARMERHVDNDPLVNAREHSMSHWFTIGYGMHRYATEQKPGMAPPAWPSIDRLRPLFEPQSLIGPNFVDVFPDESLKNAFVRLLQQIVQENEHLLPGVVNVERRGQGGVKTSQDLMGRNRIVETVGQTEQKFPATWLAHGHQSTLVWLSDLIGHVLLEAGQRVDPAIMEGIVLIDEIDLYLHPSWQVHFIKALGETFPKLQFIATTHSPILLTGLRREEVVVLERNADSGDVQWRHPDRDPRLLTGTELYEEFFEIRKLYPTDLAQTLNEYRMLAMNPFRPAGKEARIDELRRSLENEGIPVHPPVEREIEAAE